MKVFPTTLHVQPSTKTWELLFHNKPHLRVLPKPCHFFSISHRFVRDWISVSQVLPSYGSPDRKARSLVGSLLGLLFAWVDLLSCCRFLHWFQSQHFQASILNSGPGALQELGCSPLLWETATVGPLQLRRYPASRTVEHSGSQSSSCWVTVCFTVFNKLIL